MVTFIVVIVFFIIRGVHPAFNCILNIVQMTSGPDLKISLGIRTYGGKTQIICGAVVGYISISQDGICKYHIIASSSIEVEHVAVGAIAVKMHQELSISVNGICIQIIP